MANLLPYQVEAIESAVREDPEASRKLIVMPSGSGQCEVIAGVVNRLLPPGKSVLILSHRHDLTLRAMKEIAARISDVRIQKERHGARAARSFHEEGSRRAVFSTVQCLQGSRLCSFKSDAFSLLVILEAHHASNKSYHTVLRHFGCIESGQRTPVIGITGTPMRADGIGLNCVFQSVAYQVPLWTAIAEGKLCKFQVTPIYPDIDPHEIRTARKRDEYDPDKLTTAVRSEKGHTHILKAIVEGARGRSTIVYCESPRQAQGVQKRCLAKGISCEAIDDTMTTSQRRATLARYQSGETLVLASYGVLLEGIRLPNTEAIVLARRCRDNDVLVEQAIAAGLLPHPGKTKCVVLDLVEATRGKQLSSVAILDGLPANFDLEGHDPYKIADKLRQIKELDPHFDLECPKATAVLENFEKMTLRFRGRRMFPTPEQMSLFPNIPNGKAEKSGAHTSDHHYRGFH